MGSIWRRCLGAKLTLYIPARGSWLEGHVARGSAIVADRTQPTVDGKMVVYFEGAVHGYSGMERFAARVVRAAGRLQSHSPTPARALVPESDIVPIGQWDGDLGQVVLSVDPSVLRAWIGDAANLAAELLAEGRAYALRRAGIDPYAPRAEVDQLLYRYYARTGHVPPGI